jgi:hypothetical protein
VPVWQPLVCGGFAGTERVGVSSPTDKEWHKMESVFTDKVFI